MRRVFSLEAYLNMDMAMSGVALRSFGISLIGKTEKDDMDYHLHRDAGTDHPYCRGVLY